MTTMQRRCNAMQCTGDAAVYQGHYA
jgi:hypothetical protein